MSAETARDCPSFIPLGALIGQPIEIHRWGRDEIIRPVLSPVAFGDADLLMVIAPLNQRPNRYVVAVDSSWTDDNRWTDAWSDHSDEIHESLIGIFGEHPDDLDHGDLDSCGCAWPVGNWSEGKAWWPLGTMTEFLEKIS